MNYKYIKEEYLNENLIKDIKQLEKIVKDYDKISLKLELEFKLSDALEKQKHELQGLPSEFLCYKDDFLIGYFGICDFGGENPEISGMVHPEYRNNNIATNLLKEIEKEMINRGKKTYLLLLDKLSNSGNKWIKKYVSEPVHIEYEMVLKDQVGNPIFEKDIEIELAKNSDIGYLMQLDNEFGTIHSEATPDILPEELIKRGMEVYLFKYMGNIIGKINLQFQNDDAWIFGFVIDKKFRGQHLGSKSLRKSISFMKTRGVINIYLQVNSINTVALNLYQKFGFETIYSMVYYKVDLVKNEKIE